MTSKEALKYLLVNSEELYSQYEEDEKFYLDAVELYNIVLKDLEVLKIIKKYIEFNGYHYNDKDQNCIDILILESDENYRVIKEWLENDSN